MISFNQIMDLQNLKIGDRIRLARKEAGLTSQLRLAVELDFPDGQMVGRYERGTTIPPIEKLAQIAEATGKPLYWFFLGPLENPIESDPQPQSDNLFIVASKGSGFTQDPPNLFTHDELAHRLLALETRTMGEITEEQVEKMVNKFGLSLANNHDNYSLEHLHAVALLAKHDEDAKEKLESFLFAHNNVVGEERLQAMRRSKGSRK